MVRFNSRRRVVRCEDQDVVERQGLRLAATVTHVTLIGQNSGFTFTIETAEQFEHFLRAVGEPPTVSQPS
jgi:hypothetical protein